MPPHPVAVQRAALASTRAALAMLRINRFRKRRRICNGNADLK
jgi:hypothetical protein